MISHDEVLQTNATTGNGSEYDLHGCRVVTFYLTGTGTISSGAISLETSDEPSYSGTWHLLATAITASTVSGGKKAITQVNGPLRYVRARISTDIGGGGSVSIRVVAL